MRSLALSRRMAVVEAVAYGAKFNGSNASLPTNPALQVTNWFVDPQNSTGLASDNNTGQSAGAPLLTLKALLGMLGTEEPDFGATSVVVTVNMLSDTNASDPLRIRPVGGTLVIKGALTQQASGTFSAVTAAVQSTATRWNVTTASFTSWTSLVGMILNDTTVGSFAMIDADTGGGSAQVSWPMVSALTTTLPGPPAQSTFTNGDSFVVLRPSIVHVLQAGGQYVTAPMIFQNCAIQSPSGVGAVVALDRYSVLQQCTSNAFLVDGAAFENSATGRFLAVNCRLSNGADLIDPIFLGGILYGTPSALCRCSNGNQIFDGGWYGQGTNIIINAGILTLIGNSGWFVTTVTISNAALASAASATAKVGASIVGGYANPNMWGTCAVNVRERGWLIFVTAAATNLLFTGNLKLAGNNSGSSFSPSTGAFSAQTGMGSVALGAMPAAAMAIDTAISGGSPGVVAPAQSAGILKTVA